ncbi:MAG TPA: trigger factor [Candidatus Krumholzibacteria bacterium]|nr:trigger factor [Candidatus Krumholzibacteria bacterium]HPD71159.1 trigger factor [Candidatus Krumholzibacteria bacterium]HRY39141.1 trigger factor [Candidatus Krumholzibacteria bacterium]
MPEPSNLPFRLAVEAPEPCVRVIKVEVPRAEYNRQYQRRLAAAIRGHQRPGFRKGKTPPAIVEKEVGGRLRAETFEALVPQAFRAAVIEHRLLPITEPALENLVFDEDKDLAFDLRVEVRPDVTAADYDGLPVTERAVEVKTSEVDQVLERLRENRAIFETVQRPAATGDQVVVDLVPRRDDGSLDTDRQLAAQPVVIGAEQNLPAFNEALVGVEAGQERDITVTYAEDYPNPAMRDRTVTFHCRIGAVQAKILPEADDAFASRLQDGQTLLELRGRIREGLEAEARRRAAEELDEQLFDGLIARNEVPVPPSMVEAWLRSGLQELHQRNEQLGRPDSEQEDARYREAARPVAERQIKGMFLLEAVRRQEKIEVSAEDVDARIAAIAADHGFDLEKYRQFVEHGDEKDRIRHGLEERLTYDFLLSRAQITQAPVEDQD